VGFADFNSAGVRPFGVRGGFDSLALPPARFSGLHLESPTGEPGQASLLDSPPDRVNQTSSHYRYAVIPPRITTSSHANSGDTSTVVLGLHIEQLSFVPGNGIPAMYAERCEAINEGMGAIGRRRDSQRLQSYLIPPHLLP
jgi:hypothetical protein